MLRRFSAGDRLYTILTDKEHYLFSQEYKEKNLKQPLLERQLVKIILDHPTHQGHDWHPFRSGAQCRLCALHAFTASSTVEQLNLHSQAKLLEDGPNSPATISGWTRHIFDAANHLCAGQSRGESLSRVSGFPVRPDGPLDPSTWTGHVAHRMHRTGNTIACTVCQSTERINQIPSRLRQPCSQAGQKKLAFAKLEQEQRPDQKHMKNICLRSTGLLASNRITP